MSVFHQMKVYWRLATGLRGFLKEPLTLEQARSIITDRLAHREKNLLSIMKWAIYEKKNSPYLKLLESAGCEYGDCEHMVHEDGIEPMLRKLRSEGVYISIEEFAGRKEIIRGNKVIASKSSDFDNPFLLRHLEGRTGGSRGAGNRTFWDLDYIALGRAVYTICLLDAYHALRSPIVIWGPEQPGWGQRLILEHHKVGKPVTQWFSTVRQSDFHVSLKNWIWSKYITSVGRLHGAQLAMPEYVPLNRAERVAQRIAEEVQRGNQCYVHADASNGVRICQSARSRGYDIGGSKFSLCSEPVTEAKRREIESAGAQVCPRYVSIDIGAIGFGCFHPIAADEVHFFSDSLALIQHETTVDHAGVSVSAFLFSSLLPSSPKIMINVEIGDYGVIEKRKCGCYWDELGFKEHIHNIRSYEKLTSQGMTFFGTDLIRILEEVLPARFGGSSIDYQMLEEEDDTGHTHLSIIVSPEVGAIEESELVEVVLDEISKGRDTQRMMAEVWRQTRTLRVKRTRPFTTATGKLLPLHILKNQ